MIWTQGSEGSSLHELLNRFSPDFQRALYGWAQTKSFCYIRPWLQRWAEVRGMNCQSKPLLTPTAVLQPYHWSMHCILQHGAVPELFLSQPLPCSSSYSSSSLLTAQETFRMLLLYNCFSFLDCMEWRISFWIARIQVSMVQEAQIGPKKCTLMPPYAHECLKNRYCLLVPSIRNSLGHRSQTLSEMVLPLWTSLSWKCTSPVYF